jgi:hypothetical protein
VITLAKEGKKTLTVGSTVFFLFFFDVCFAPLRPSDFLWSKTPPRGELAVYVVGLNIRSTLYIQSKE